MSTFGQKRVWHSFLRSTGQIILQFTSDIRESDYRDGEYIRYFKVKGDDTDYYYVIENDTIKEQLENQPKNQWVQVTAAGGGNEPDAPEATMDIQAAEGPDIDDNYNPGGGSGGGSSDDLDEQYGPRLGPEAILAQYELVVEKVKERFPWVTDDDGELTDVGGRVVNTVYINWIDTGRRQPLFEGQDEDVASDGKAVRIREELDTLDWDGQSHDGRDLAHVKERLEKMADAIESNEVPASKADDVIGWLNDEAEAQDAGSPLGDDDLPF